MKHVIQKLELWLAGELSNSEAVALQEHLAVCPICAERAKELRLVWQALDSLEGKPDPAISVWPVVRARTIGLAEREKSSGWFFGSGESLRAGLAATAVAAGLALAFLLPAGSSLDNSGALVAGLDGNMDLDWLSDSSVFSADTGSLLDDVWLGAGLDNEGDGS